MKNALTTGIVSLTCHAVDLSLVIRTFNSAITLQRLLNRLDFDDRCEVIVVDSGSTDGTLLRAKELGAHCMVARGPFNYSKSLNLGFKAARGAWVLAMSSHAIPVGPHLVETYRKLTQGLPEDVAVIYGPSGITGKDPFAFGSRDLMILNAQDEEQFSCVCGNANTLYRRSAWQQLPFDESIRTAEDKAWLSEALRQGFRFAYAPKAAVLNRSQYSLRYMFLKGFSDTLALNRSGHKAMKLWQLGGALKNLAVKKFRGDIDTGNWLRYSAHIFGQFFGSRRKGDNTPWR